MIPIILLVATVLVAYGLMSWLRAVAHGRGRTWLRLFAAAWRGS